MTKVLFKNKNKLLSLVFILKNLNFEKKIFLLFSKMFINIKNIGYFDDKSKINENF